MVWGDQKLNLKQDFEGKWPIWEVILGNTTQGAGSEAEKGRKPVNGV